MRTKIGLLLVSLFMVGCTSEDGLIEAQEAYNSQIEVMQEEVALLEASHQLSLEDKAALEEVVTLHEGTIENLQLENMALEDEIVALTAELYALKQTNQTPTVVEVSEEIVMLMANGDFAGLANHVHPSQGLRLTPYPYIDFGTDLVMSGAQVANFALDTTLYNWGSYDGSGDPIQMTALDYFNTFVYDEDYMNPDLVSWNNSVGSGNMINNLTTVYPSADFVEYHFSGFDPQYAGMDWTSLTLVFEQVGSDWYLVGVVHGQWTT